MKQLYTLLESATFLHFPELYAALGIKESRFQTARQFNKAIAKQAPDIMLAEFRYGFGNNYAGVNVSNLDVSLYALQRRAPLAKIIVLADKAERPHISKLKALFRIDTVLELPCSKQSLKTALQQLNQDSTD